MIFPNESLDKTIVLLKAFENCDQIANYATRPDDLSDALSKFWDTSPSDKNNLIVPDSREMDSAPPLVSYLVNNLVFDLKDNFQYGQACAPKDMFEAALLKRGYRAGEFDTGDYVINWVETKHGVLILA